MNSGSCATAVTRGWPNGVKDGSGLAKSTDWKTEAVRNIDENNDVVTEGVADVDTNDVVPGLSVDTTGGREGSGVVLNGEIGGELDGETVMDSSGSVRSGDLDTVSVALPNEALGDVLCEIVVDTVGVDTGTSHRSLRTVSSMEENSANEPMGV